MNDLLQELEQATIRSYAYAFNVPVATIMKAGGPGSGRHPEGTLYHGTTKENADKISKEGLKLPKKGIHVTSDKNYAQRAATSKAEDTGSKHPVLIVLKKSANRYFDDGMTEYGDSHFHQSTKAKLGPEHIDRIDKIKAEGTQKKFTLEDTYTFQGMTVCIENKKGSTRSGKEPSGKPWSIKMPFDYGYIKGTKGTDGDEVDVFIGPNKNAKYVYVVHQRVNGKEEKYDEDKCMLGFPSADAAKKAYHSAYNNVDLFTSMTMLSLKEFKKKLKKYAGGKIHAAIAAGGPGSGRHKENFLTKEEKLAEHRAKELAKRRALNEQGKSQRGKEIITEKQRRAVASANVASKEHQDVAEQVEHNVAGATKGVKQGDNKPFDVIATDGQGRKHGIEVKALMFQKNNKLTMSSKAIRKKISFAKHNKLYKMHTVAVDMRNGKDNPIVYHREGVGSFRVDNMTPVKGNLKGLAKQLNLK